MESIIPNGRQLKQRQLIAGLITAATCGAGVYLFHVPFHAWLVNTAGLSARLIDSVGSITIVLVGILINNYISLVIFKDISLGKQGGKREQPQASEPE